MRCLACGATELEFWTTVRDVEYMTIPDMFALHRCQSCDALSMDPIPSERLDEIYPGTYYSFVAGQKSLPQRVKEALDRRQFRRLLAQLPGESLRVLDVGGGSGFLLDQVRDADARVRETCVVDFDREAEKVARANGHATFLGRIEDFPNTDARFDLILLLNLIEHVIDPGAVLAKCESLLAPGGLILLKTPNWRCLDEKLFRKHNWGGYHTPRHWVLFTRPSLVRLAEQQGLHVRKLSYTQGGWFWAVSVLAWMHARNWIRASAERPLNRHPLFGLVAAAGAAFDFARAPFMTGSQMFLELTRKADS